jgi:hypothetical protein
MFALSVSIERGCCGIPASRAVMKNSYYVNSDILASHFMRMRAFLRMVGLIFQTGIRIDALSGHCAAAFERGTYAGRGR